MVGVSYMIIILYYLSGNVYCIDRCPEKCNCLGDYLLCTGNKLQNIPKIPQWTGRLNLNNNHIKIIDGKVWKNATKLSELKLSKNKISNINKETFENQNLLVSLELNRNEIKEIEALTFKYLKKLKVLKLKRNRITQLSDGAFFGLDEIRSLKLDYNYIKSIAKRWLYGLNSLKELSVNHNNVSLIETDAWEFCRVLSDLDLSHNKLTVLKKDTFAHLAVLEKLYLNNNEISIIEDGSFSHISYLKVLQLSNNKISVIIEDSNGIFKHLNKLHKFYLAANDIKSINKNAFIGLNEVITFDLSKNNITSIQKNAFSEMPFLQDLHLNTMSLLCDCNIKWFYDWLQNKKLKLDTVCAHPEWLRNQSLLDIAPANFTCEGDLTKPRLIEEPEPEIMALKNANISLCCKAMSPNVMTVQWKKSDTELKNANITSETITNKKNTEVISVLNIYKVQHSDAGVYQCVVSNNFGATYSQKTNISVLIFPTFSKQPKNVTVSSGTTVRLECAAEGEPPPQISWQKDGGHDFPSARERRIHVMHTDDVIFIRNAKPADMGVYTCTASNPAGKISANAILAITEEPYFGKQMENKEITAGASVVLQCMAGGSPKPTIQWLKDGEPIHATERHFFTAEDQLMIIVDTLSTDAGTYECLLSNSLGNKTGYSKLLVKPGLISQNDKMGIILITVVCCAVATSIVWVAIIYHTRRRMKRTRAANISSPDVPRLDFAEKAANHFSDDISDHSSCKDSGTGDSAKRSNDDLLPTDEYAIIIKDVGPVDPQSTMRTASLVCLSSERNNSHTPLLYSDKAFIRSTNHDRLPEGADLKLEEKNTATPADE